MIDCFFFCQGPPLGLVFFVEKTSNHAFRLSHPPSPKEVTCRRQLVFFEILLGVHRAHVSWRSSKLVLHGDVAEMWRATTAPVIAVHAGQEEKGSNIMLPFQPTASFLHSPYQSFFLSVAAPKGQQQNKAQRKLIFRRIVPFIGGGELGMRCSPSFFHHQVRLKATTVSNFFPLKQCCWNALKVHELSPKRSERCWTPHSKLSQNHRFI